MILSGKQAFKLILIARGYVDHLFDKGGIHIGPANNIMYLIEEIMNQQSEELIELEKETMDKV